MASARTTWDGHDGDAAAPAPFVWVSLRDPSPDELAAVQREFGLPAPLVDALAIAARRPVLELTGELLFAVVKTTTWVAAEEAVRLGEVQLVLGDGFVVGVDRDGVVLERVRQDLEDDPELAGAGSRPGSRSGPSRPAGGHLRDELPAPAGARLGLRLPAGAGGDGAHLRGAVPRVPA
jgi:hypothetical protein